MTNPYYDHSTYPGPNAPGSSAALRAEFDKVEAAFDLLPTLSGNASKLVAVKADGSGLEAVTSISVTSITATSVTASSFTGPLTGNVTGNVTASSGLSTFNNVTISGTLNASTVTGIATPVNNTDAANKAYVDTVAQGLDIKASVKAATTANITLSGGQTIDGVTVTDGDRVLVKDQSTASQNGIYVVASGSWTRATDFDAWPEIPGAFTFIEQGTVNDNTGWVCTVAPGGTIGSTAITFEQFSGAGQVIAGAGLTKSGNSIDVGTASTSRIVVNANDIDLATTGVTPGSYNQLTVDAYGRVTAAINNNFAAQYLGAKSSAPTVDNQGNALIVGAMYFDTTLNKMRVYSASSTWVDAGSTVNGTSARSVYVATAGQSTFAITYDVGFVDVYLNGLKLQAGVEFVATNGTSVSLATTAAAGDIIDMVAYGTFAVANTYTQAQTDTLLAAKLSLAGGTMSGAITFAAGQTFPSSVATLTGTQTLTNKTIEAGTFTNGYTEESVAANTSTAYTIDLANGTVQILTLTGNCTFTFPTPTAGQSFMLLLKQDATGSRTATWPATVKWPGGTAPTITSTASKTDKFVFTADGTYWVGSNAGQNYTL